MNRKAGFYKSKMNTARLDLQRLVSWLTRLPTIKLIPLALVFTYVASGPTIALAVFHPGMQLGGLAWGRKDLIRIIVLGCIVAPLLVFAIEDARGGHPFLAPLAVHALRNWITAALTEFIL